MLHTENFIVLYSLQQKPIDSVSAVSHTYIKVHIHGH